MGEKMQGNFINGKYPGSSGSDYTQYVVKKDDSLYKIAKAYNTTVDELISLNNLPSNVIYPNQILLIPKSSNTVGNNTYLTKSGDTIGSILKKYNISFSDLDKYNDLDKLQLLGNQLLYVGTTNNVCTLEVRGDLSIDDVLDSYRLTPLEFLRLNEKNILKPGSKINIR